MAKLKVQIAALTALGIEAPEHATEMTHSRVKTTLKFLQCNHSTDKLGREMKLCDPTNIGMFKSMYFLENNNNQPRAIQHVHVTDKQKHCGRRNLIRG